MSMPAMASVLTARASGAELRGSGSRAATGCMAGVSAGEGDEKLASDPALKALLLGTAHLFVSGTAATSRMPAIETHGAARGHAAMPVSGPCTNGPCGGSGPVGTNGPCWNCG